LLCLRLTASNEFSKQAVERDGLSTSTISKKQS
jgi:hypothetical protein